LVIQSLSVSSSFLSNFLDDATRLLNLIHSPEVQNNSLEGCREYISNGTENKSNLHDILNELIS